MTIPKSVFWKFFDYIQAPLTPLSYEKKLVDFEDIVLQIAFTLNKIKLKVKRRFGES